jgi:hypothetical protein
LFDFGLSLVFQDQALESASIFYTQFHHFLVAEVASPWLKRR